MELFLDLTIPGPLSIQQRAPQSKLVLCGVDPGVVNCGIAFYDAVTRLGIYARLVSFKKSSDKKPLKRDELIARASEFFQSAEFQQKITLYGVKYYVVEDQIHSLFDNESYHGKKGASEKSRFARSKYAGTHEVIPYVLKTLFPNKVLIVSPRAIKLHFAEFFPQDDSLTEEQQYRLNKKNSIIGGQTFFSNSALVTLENYKKQDDITDAAFNARYGAEVYFDENLEFVTDKNKLKQLKAKRKREKRLQSKPPKESTPKKRVKKKAKMKEEIDE